MALSFMPLKNYEILNFLRKDLHLILLSIILDSDFFQVKLYRWYMLECHGAFQFEPANVDQY